MPTWASLTNGLLVIESIRIIQPIYYPTENSVEVSESGGFESFQGPTVQKRPGWTWGSWWFSWSFILICLAGWQGDKVLNVLSHIELYNLLWSVHLLVMLCESNSIMAQTTCLPKALLRKVSLLGQSLLFSKQTPCPPWISPVLKSGRKAFSFQGKYLAWYM